MREQTDLLKKWTEQQLNSSSQTILQRNQQLSLELHKKMVKASSSVLHVILKKKGNWNCFYDKSHPVCCQSRQGTLQKQTNRGKGMVLYTREWAWHNSDEKGDNKISSNNISLIGFGYTFHFTEGGTFAETLSLLDHINTASTVFHCTLNTQHNIKFYVQNCTATELFECCVFRSRHSVDSLDSSLH